MPETSTKIGNVAIDLSHYRGSDEYSDGDVEDAILDVVKRGLSYEEVIALHPNWPMAYHMSPVRENLLSWYPFSTDSKVLEVGAGCGAVTGVLCSKAKSVVAIELSKRRAEILATRHKYAKNLEVVVGNLNDIGFGPEFDYVTLIGVLEYAGKFTPGPSPYIDFLKTVTQFVKPGGTLLIAIENRYGLKYWSGAPEDHTGLYFDGIEGYVRGEGAQTFSRERLIEIIALSGLTVDTFYYPTPDYKMPVRIFSDDCLPSRWDVEFNIPNFVGTRFRLFDKVGAWDGVVHDRMFPFFANSFLVECKQGSVA